MSRAKVSNAIIRRLPRYRRYLGQLQVKGIKKISSGELSELIGYTASQIRQDLNTFGEFGQQGYGYEVDKLYKEINKILGLDREYRTVVVGVGNLGQAITNYTYYYKIGFNIIGLFDKDPEVIGKVINDVTVMDADILEGEEKFYEQLEEMQKNLQERINKLLGKNSQVSEVDAMKEPFEKNATQKIRRFLYKNKK